jgi:hypothetical protein
MTVLEALDALEAKAETLKQAHIAPNTAIAAREKIASDHLRPLVDAAEGTLNCNSCYQHGLCSLHWGELDEALAAVGRDIAKALEA